jgi:drug/metabolite transporter (DMT)-like permease
MLLAVLATLIWSGNFIVARGVVKQIPPVSLAFFRWSCASLILLPFAWSNVQKDKAIIWQNRWHLLFAGLTGVSVFNTLVYIAGHFTSAINLALIGTTSSPIFSFILARIFLKEKIPPFRLAGLLVCIAGILLLLSRGSMDVLLHFKFTEGDWWVLGGAFSFAVYNILARKKPVGIAPKSYLLVTFCAGTLLLIPFFIWEQLHSSPMHWNASLVGIILYLGAGASVAAFFCWNIAIASLGASRTAIFGNLIPIFSTIEAVLILGEKISWVHVASMCMVIAGLVIANIKQLPKT